MSRTLRIFMDGGDTTAVPIPDEVTASDDDLVAAVRSGDPSAWPEVELLRQHWELYAEVEPDPSGFPDDAMVIIDRGEPIGNRLDDAQVVVEHDDIPFRPQVTVTFTVSMVEGTDPQAAAFALFQLFADAPDDQLPGIVAVDSYEVVDPA